MKIGYVVVTYIKSDLVNHIAHTSLASLKVSNRQPDEMYVVNNYLDDKYKDEWDVDITNDKNILARAWNKGIKMAIDDGCDLIIVANLDIFLAQWCLKYLIESAMNAPDKEILWSGNGINPLDTKVYMDDRIETYRTTRDNFSLFAIKPSTIKKIGWFDENYVPCYREDTDYQKRIELAGCQHKCVGGAMFWHLHSSTVKFDPEISSAGKSIQADKYLKKKWGGTYRRLPYARPFNDQQYTYKDTDFVIFDCDWEVGEGFYTNQSMAENRRFLYDMVEKLKPKRIVELGTFYGTSYFSFAQAIKDNDLDTELIGIDHFNGDDCMPGYPDSVKSVFTRIKDKLFNSDNYKILIKDFDEAVKDIDKNSVDILLIDGNHTYADIKHDYESWLPKMKRSSLVLLHDTNVDKPNFGVREFYDKLDEDKYNRPNEYGLGIVAPRGPAKLKKLGLIKDVVIYSAVYGGYDNPPEQPISVNYYIDEERGAFKPEWDNRKKAKYFKILAPPECDYSIWVDGNVKITNNNIAIKYAEILGDNLIGLFSHPDRSTIKAEAEECKRRGKVENTYELTKQLRKYKKESCPDQNLYGGTVFIRNHNHKRFNEFNKLWWHEVNKGSIRDQISLPYVLWKLGIKPVILPGNLFDNKDFKKSNHKK